MPREFGRHRRIAELIKHELAAAIQQQFPVNEYGLITVSAVDVSPDLRNAKIYITCLEIETSIEALVKELNEHAGFFRTRIAKTMSSRSVPKLTFKYDASVAQGEHLTSLIESLDLPEEDD